MSVCGSEVETTEHFLFRCHLYSALKLELLETLEKVDLNVNGKVCFLLHCNQLH